MSEKTNMATGVDARKEELRASCAALRKSLSDAERARADAEICERVCSSSQFQAADVVFTYLSFGAEVDTHAIIERAWAADKRVALPRCTGPREMRWFSVESLEGLERSRFGVDEPPLDEAREVIPSDCARAVALVPGLTFDASGYRLGYGGGFYDAFLADFAGASVGLCREAQRSENLAALGVVDTCDRPVDTVIFA